MSAGPRVSDTKNRGNGSLDGTPAELTDGDVFGDDDGTSVTASTSRVD